MFCPVVSGRPICISKTNVIKIGLEVSEIFLTAAVLDFKNSQIWLADRFRRAKMHRQNLSICCRVIAIFQDGHLGFVWGIFGPLTKGTLVVFITVQNLVAIDAVVLKIWKFAIFRMFGLPQKIRFLGIWPLKWTAVSTKPQKVTSLHKYASFEPSSATISRLVWPVGEFAEKRI